MASMPKTVELNNASCPGAVFAPSAVAAPGDHKYVSVPDPPLAVAVAEPSLTPHVAVVVFTLPAIAPGCVMFTNVVLEQPAASVTVTVYVPAVNPLALALVPAPLLQE